MRFDDDWDFPRYFPKSVPRQAKGGIRAESQRGTFGGTWWAKRWIAVLESFNIGARLQRGRNYARRGQVLSIDIGKGTVAAAVQGSRPSPYKVNMRVKPLGKKEWAKVATAVASRALFASKLLAGEMPNEMEQAFKAAGVSLFPARQADLTTSCSCPDWSNPCKHIAAVYYLIGEEFDRDPFLIFRMRGMAREEFMALMGESGIRADEAAVEITPEPLPAEPSRFWNSGRIADDVAGPAPGAPAGAAIARRLGKFPFWRGARPLADFLDGVYRDAAAAASAKLSE